MVVQIGEPTDEYSIASMKLVAHTASIEMTIELLIWILLDVPPAYGQPISGRLSIWPKVKIITSLLERRKAQLKRFKRYKARLKEVCDLRNQLVHAGLWLHYTDDSSATIIDIGRRADNPGEIAHQNISLKGIQKTAAKAEKLSQELASFAKNMKPLPKNPRALKPKK